MLVNDREIIFTMKDIVKLYGKYGTKTAPTKELITSKMMKLKPKFVDEKGVNYWSAERKSAEETYIESLDNFFWRGILGH